MADQNDQMHQLQFLYPISLLTANPQQASQTVYKPNPAKRLAVWKFCFGAEMLTDLDERHKTRKSVLLCRPQQRTSCQGSRCNFLSNKYECILKQKCCVQKTASKIPLDHHLRRLNNCRYLKHLQVTSYTCSSHFRYHPSKKSGCKNVLTTSHNSQTWLRKRHPGFLACLWHSNPCRRPPRGWNEAQWKTTKPPIVEFTMCLLC